ncbi:YibE/F family protein [Herbivorax sp. ANBcel31]|uniref:YibE/F family protein n=1 Tax=Herbivorax sp. ANBcel31 TaxID=3069754 RepID=UPI0027B68BD8|nr:YibE/F family protein [Herbivorax sp. ANBcel31]MDQ2086717.1 YibE/F family protein [Herbivorax sp. ANBcel31]
MKTYKSLVVFLILPIFLYCSIIQVHGTDSKETEYFETVRGKVIEILNSEKDNIEKRNKPVSCLVKVEILNGKHSGKVVNAEYTISAGYVNKENPILIKPRDTVLIYLNQNSNGEVINAYISDTVRDKYLLYLVGTFIFFLLAIGRFKGLKAIITLGVTAFAIIKFFIPLIIEGYDPIAVSIGVCIVITTLTLIIIGGLNKKAAAAIIGTIGGFAVAGGITQFIGSLANLTGLGNEEAQMLMNMPQSVNINFRGLLFSGIIIGALGATMDVGMSISSAMHEIEMTNPKIKKSALIGSGMNIGRDIMATMSNTLILAYAGSSLHLLLLLIMHDIPFIEIINSDMIASEVVRSLAGSLGLIFTIPITAIAAGVLSSRKQSHNPGRKRKKQYV